MKLNYTITPTHITIKDSYKITNEWVMMACIERITREIGRISSKRMYQYINEWAAHNLLYNWHLFRSHTKDVDIDRDGGSWWMRLLYGVGAYIYNKVYGAEDFK